MSQDQWRDHLRTALTDTGVAAAQILTTRDGSLRVVHHHGDHRLTIGPATDETGTAVDGLDSVTESLVDGAWCTNHQDHYTGAGAVPDAVHAALTVTGATQ